jgi:excisionase family DNA binding protein
MAGSEKSLAARAKARAQGTHESQGVEEYFSPESLARRLECSVAKVRKSIWRGELEGVRIGRLVRIPASSVQRWLEASRPARHDAARCATALGPRSGPARGAEPLGAHVRH